MWGWFRVEKGKTLSPRREVIEATKRREEKEVVTRFSPVFHQVPSAGYTKTVQLQPTFIYKPLSLSHDLRP